jgi:L-ascorbate metabolism protein UlaG (beta-lactamase superfamily)
MKIKWLGHSCFKITSSKGTRILTDPFDDNVGYNIPSVETDIVTISHNHYDHNYVDCVRGSFEVINKTGDCTIKDIVIKGVHTYHDSENGGKRGDNRVFVFEMDDMRICHLGDLGHLLTEEQLDQIGKVDVVFVPVGGNYTLDATEANAVISQLNPKIAIPMHFKTPVLRFELATVDSFIEQSGNAERLGKQVLELKLEDLSKNDKKVIILNYE